LTRAGLGGAWQDLVGLGRTWRGLAGLSGAGLV